MIENVFVGLIGCIRMTVIYRDHIDMVGDTLVDQYLFIHLTTDLKMV